MRKMAVCLVVACVCGFAAAAEENKVLTEEQNKQAAQWLTDLGADSFETRNKAEQQLLALGTGVLPLLKETVAKSSDAEVKTRANRVIQQLSLEAEPIPTPWPPRPRKKQWPNAMRGREVLRQGGRTLQRAGREIQG